MSLLETIEELNSDLSIENQVKAKKLKLKLKIIGLILLILGGIIAIISLISFIITGYKMIKEFESITPSIISFIILLPALLICGIGFYLFKISSLIKTKNVSD